MWTQLPEHVRACAEQHRSHVPIPDEIGAWERGQKRETPLETTTSLVNKWVTCANRVGMLHDLEWLNKNLVVILQFLQLTTKLNTVTTGACIKMNVNSDKIKNNIIQ